MKLASSLGASGIDAWTPIGISAKRKGPARDRVEEPVAMLPTWVFARAEHIGELHRICGLFTSPHPAFSIFRYYDRVPLITDRDISSLRAAEDEVALARRKRERRVIPIGSSIRLNEGAFAGLSGIVEQSDGKTAIVAFGDRFRVEIATWLLPQDLLEASVSNSDTRRTNGLGDRAGIATIAAHASA